MSQDESKYDGAACILWLVSMAMGGGVGLIKNSLGWGLIAWSISFVILVAGISAAFWFDEREERK